jgi:hypothetical protein
MRRLWRRYRALGTSERAWIVRAAVTLALTRVGLWILPLGALRRLLDTHQRDRRSSDPRVIAWAVAAAGRRIPWSTCLVEALAADYLLRRAGFAPELRIGMRRGASVVPLEAHAWVMCGGQVLIGNDQALDQYVVLSPSGAAS